MEKKIKTTDKAQTYAQSVIDNFGTNGVPIGIKDIKKMLAEAYLAGLSDQWRDTSDTPPIDEDVLVDYPYEHGYAVAYYDGKDWYLTETGRLLHRHAGCLFHHIIKLRGMSNRRFRKYPQTIILRCPCCQEVKYALCHFDSTGEAEYCCQCGHISKIKLAKLNNK